MEVVNYLLHIHIMNTQQSSSNLTANKQPQLDINNTSTRLVQSQQQKQQISDDSDSSQFTLNTIFKLNGK